MTVLLPAQIDTTLSIDIITISDFKQSQFIKINENNLNTPFNLTDYLRKRSQLFVRSYGSGSSATLSYKGSSANQILVKWNNVPLNNGMLGVSDISLLPLQLFTSIDVSNEDQDGLRGSSSIAGILNLSSKSNVENNQVDVTLAHGSFGMKSASFDINFSENKFSGHTKLFYNYSDNDFTYKLGNGTERINEHGQFIQYGVQQNVNYNIDNNKKLSLDLWVQNTDREIPPTTTQNKNQSTQNDAFYRVLLNYDQTMDNQNLNLKAAYFNEENNYLDSINLIDNHNIYKRIYASAQHEYFVKSSLSLFTKLEYNNLSGSSESYNQIEKTNQVSLHNQIRKNWRNSLISFNVNSEWSNFSGFNVNPSLKYVHHFNENITADASLARVFRYPTLNELYWNPGGNPDLENEFGWTQNLDIKFNLKHNALLRVELYHRLINNWILWGLPENGQTWAAFNIAKVRSYGVELVFNKKWHLSKNTFEFDAIYSQTNSKNLIELMVPKINEGDQLFYTPKHQFKVTPTYGFGKFSLALNAQYYSAANGINDNIENYSLFSAHAIYNMMINKTKFQFGVSVENIFDSSYRIIERRAMPGRHFNMIFKIKY